jgi:HlyD family secretion protein
MMKILKIILVALILAGLSVTQFGCGSASDEAETLENQVATVQRGNLVTDITAAGNLALSYTAEPAFKIAGYVEEVLVEEGDSVEEGQVLARLDSTTLEQSVTTAERAVKSAEMSLEQADNSYQELITPYPYQTYGYIVPDCVQEIDITLARMEEAEEEIREGITGESYSIGEVLDKLVEATEVLSEARTRLAWGFGAGIRPTGLDYWTLRTAQLKVDSAQLSLEKEVEALDKAIDELEKAVVVAPFAGFITSVNVEGGDEVYKGTVVAQLADPDKFEADILVSEMDIMEVKEGGEAWVQVDAMSGLSLPAEVVHISPTATIQSGVVNYEVKVEIESLEAVMQEQQEARQEVIGRLSSGELPEHLQQAIEEGQITQEQVEEMMKQMQQVQESQQGQTPTAIPEDFQLREGLTVTVSIILDERDDVLLVPNGAVSTQGGQTYVQVMSVDGTIEQRSVTTGITNYVNTEVISGLSEGEQVIVPQGTTSTSTTTQERQGMMFFGGPPR